MNQPPEYCPYCGPAVTAVEGPHVEHSTLESVGTPSVFRCEHCDDYVFHNAEPGDSAVVDGDRLLLVEDFRSIDGWKLPSGRVDLGERRSREPSSARGLEGTAVAGLAVPSRG